MSLQDFLNTFIRTSGLKVHFEIEARPETVEVNFSGEDAPILLARNAETLRALEYLSNHIFERKDGRKIAMDCNGYRAVRADELRLMAVTAAEQVKRLGRPFKFSPMAADERRIIHLAVAEDPDLRTESEGFGENRKVVIYLK